MKWSGESKQEQEEGEGGELHVFSLEIMWPHTKACDSFPLPAGFWASQEYLRHILKLFFHKYEI